MKTIEKNGTIRYEAPRGCAPTVLFRSGRSEWRQDDGRPHREDGPSVTYPNGNTTWFLYGQVHREGRPAVVKCDGNNTWWVNGEKVGGKRGVFSTLRHLLNLK
jgi:hypothetical protein